jgi:hypothetical protein
MNGGRRFKPRSWIMGVSIFSTMTCRHLMSTLMCLGMLLSVSEHSA